MGSERTVIDCGELEEMLYELISFIVLPLLILSREHLLLSLYSVLFFLLKQ